MDAADDTSDLVTALAVDRAIAGALTSAYQPIVDLGRGSVAGYEAFLRYEEASITAGQLIASARRLGRSVELEAAALRSALARRGDVPSDCFLCVNISAAALRAPEVTAVLDAEPALDGIVLELTDTDPAVVMSAADVLAQCRARGAAIAVAHCGLAYADLSVLFAIEPAFVKLSRDVVDGVARDNVRLALAETISHLAARLGVRLVAEGIEDMADLHALKRLGIELGQGFLLARPSSMGAARVTHAEVDAPRAAGHGLPAVATIAEHALELTLDDVDREIDPAGAGVTYEVIVGDLREPLALMRRSGQRVESIPMTLIADATSIVDAARLALGRPAVVRFEPVVCVDAFGACVGVVRMERVMASLAEVAGARAGRPRANRPRHRR